MYEIYLEWIKKKLKNDTDITYKVISCDKGVITLIYSNIETDKDYISHYIITPIVKNQGKIENSNIIEDILFAAVSGQINEKEVALQKILAGAVVIISNLSNKIIFCDAKKIKERALERPINEPTSKGPQIGFNENIITNINLIRRGIKSADLKVEKLMVGTESKTMVVIMYMEGKAPDDLITLIRTKISNLKLNFIIGTNYIEEQLKCKNTNFDTIGYTEKPDVLISKLFEGRVAVMVDGTPVTITAPTFLLEYFQAPDDYYLNRNTVNIIRFIRLASFAITMYLPGFYIALFTHHFSLIPQIFVFRIAEDRSGVPLPTVVEVLVMLFFFELTRETGKRLPPSIGQSISIVSSLILGQAAIGAGMASQGTIIVMGIYAITSYINPKLATATPVWTVLCIVSSALFGLHGFFIFHFVTIASIAGLNSCGYPFLYPIGTAEKHFFKGSDFLWRGPLSKISNKLFQGGEKH